MLRALKFARLSVLLAPLVACGSGPEGASDPGSVDPNVPIVPGTPVEPLPPPAVDDEYAAVKQKLDAVAHLTAESFASAYAPPFSGSGLGYDPATAAGLATIQGSSLKLAQKELDALGKSGFVVVESHHFPSFVHGYETLYAEDLPLYISADSILTAVHRSYDALLATIETGVLIPSLADFLDRTRAGLAAGGATDVGPDAREDADFYLTVAASLLAGKLLPPSATADPGAIQAFYQGAVGATGAKTVTLFGVARNEDFSQFAPRGHYQGTPELEQYFRAMMWLGRVDLRLIETQEDGSRVFHRRQLEGALALRELCDDEARADWSQIDQTVSAFVGEHDSMILPQLDALMTDLGVAAPADLASVGDATIAQAIVDGRYGAQRISSAIMVNGLGETTMPLSSTFLLFGQRYVLDSHVFSNVVYDRVQGGSVYRMMPSPLDAAFAAFGNDEAGALLQPELDQYSYAPDLASMRVLVDEHHSEYWQSSLYTLWVDTLRALSPKPEAASPSQAGLPAVAGTEAWGRRLLSTQLASWADLRHDTLLYAKQSYTSGAGCEFPDAYVDPYPEFYAKLVAFAEHGTTLLDTLDLSAAPWLKDYTGAYFQNLGSVAGTLQSMAEAQRTGTPFTTDQMAFVNDAVTIRNGCDGPDGADGWYGQLFFDQAKAIEYDPTIADVHTQPTDEAGNPVGKVLHVGTGMPRLLVVTVDTCNGPRAYAGLASSYFERITENFERLDDEGWAETLNTATPADPAWLSDVIVR